MGIRKSYVSQRILEFRGFGIGKKVTLHCPYMCINESEKLSICGYKWNRYIVNIVNKSNILPKCENK